MGKNDKNKSGQDPENIEQIMRERGRLDQIIHKKFRKRMAILFSDVCGYTQFMDTRGDIAGRAWIQKHHDIVLPLIEQHGGKVLDIMGDGVMASFPTSLPAVQASMEIQRSLNKYNKETGTADEIHVSMGVNTGDILVDEEHIAGDVVNVASRIESKADRDQILIAKSTYEDVCGSEDVLCRAHGSVSVKGKAEPLELYRVVWQDEEIILGEEPLVRAVAGAVKARSSEPLKMLQLELTRDEDRLKISVSEQSAGEVSTVRHYEEIPVPIDRIRERCREIVETLNNANRKGRLTRDILMRLRELGQLFRDDLFTLNVKSKMQETKADHLLLSLDDQLVHVPWELLHDGKQFLCQRFNMGRLVRTRQTIIGSKGRRLERPLKMLVLADPKGDLKGAYEEGKQIRDFMDRDRDVISASLRSDDITPDFIREKIRKFDLVHFAGHADYNPESPGKGGWRLTDGLITAQDISKMAGTAAMPALIFSNACQSARTEEWGLKEHFQDEIFGLANAFILAGVKHYVGTFWEILDEPSRLFALEFYKKVRSGMTVGEAVRQARMELINRYGEETIVWASYLLYGDPTSNYMEQIMDMEVLDDEAEEPPAREETMRVSVHEDKIVFGEKEEKKVSSPGRYRWAAVAVVIVLAAFMLWGYPGFLREDTQKYEIAIMTHYNEGNFNEALNVSKALEKKSPKVRLAYLANGNIHLRRGNLDMAEAAYQKALQAAKGTDAQKAEALIGLGRIASFRKQSDKSLKYYQQATEAAPENRIGYLSQGLLFENRGDYDQALTLLGKAQEIAPNDRVVAAITSETRKKVAIARDQEKQERIDKLVDELLKGIDSPPRALLSDGWTSQPLTLWLMDFKIRGYSLQEGEDRLVASGITDQLLRQSRVQVVERSLLDKLLEELKLGTSKLIDRRTALSLGRILAARLILSGHIIYSGPQTQVSMRLIETETGRITAAVNETFGSAMPASVLAEKLSSNLLGKLKKLYPLRGKISKVKEDEVTLNMGQREGVRIGQMFKIQDTETVLEIIGVQQGSSMAKLKEGDDDPEEDSRVEII